VKFVTNIRKFGKFRRFWTSEARCKAAVLTGADPTRF
jgi:hypothetical protein